MSVVSPVIGFLTSNTRFVATFQMLRNSKERRMVSILSGTPLWSRIQTRTGVKVPTSATARSRKTPLASPGAGSPSRLDSISPIASALPTANGLNRFESLTPEATMKLRQRTSSSRPNRRASARTSP